MFPLRLPLVVEVEVNDVDGGVAVVYTGTDGDTEEVAEELVERTAGRSEALEERVPGLVVGGPDERADGSSYTTKNILQVTKGELR